MMTFVLEAAGGDEKKDGAHGVKRQAVEPEMRKPAPRRMMPQVMLM